MNSIRNLQATIFLIVCFVSNNVYSQQKVALLVGVTTYSNAGMNGKPLKYPEADADAIAKVLEESGYKVTLLNGKAATRDAVLLALEQIQNQGDQEGVLVLGFFGHGVQYGESAFFCPYDTGLRVVKDKDNNILRYASGLPRQEPDPASMVSMRQMLDTLALSPAGSKMLLADCCREDPNIARGGLRGRAFGDALRVDQLPKNTAALFACSEGEQAFEHEDWQHGAFTKALLTSLTSGKRVTAAGLLESVDFGVEELVRAKGERQRVNGLLAGGSIDLKLRVSARPNTEMSRSDRPTTTTPPTNDSSSKTSSPRSFVNSVGATMVLIPAGSFLRGSPDTDAEAADDEKPQHQVTLTRSFYMGETEVTQGQWKAVMGTEPWKGQGFVKEGPNYPATYVGREDAVEYCRRLSGSEGREYRLPTEAEWEYAGRVGRSTKYSFGDDASVLSQYGWFSENTWDKNEKYAHAVKQKLANGFGLHDMHGNVWEWCSDHYATNYAGSSITDPTGPSTGNSRVCRGGGWNDRAGICRSAGRYRSTPGYRDSDLGFRLFSVSQ